MSSHYEATCEICRHKQQVEKFGDWQCASCKQEYAYDEGHAIRLSDEQRCLLEEAKAIQGKIKPMRVEESETFWALNSEQYKFAEKFINDLWDGDLAEKVKTAFFDDIERSMSAGANCRDACEAWGNGFACAMDYCGH